MSWRWSVASALVVLAGAAAYGARGFNLSALPDPGPVETAVANHARDWYIRRAAEQPLPPPPALNADMGQALFGMDCATCHGQDGRHPSPIGRSLYPRAVDLASPAVQRLSDAELFWIIHNGIRMTGMPGFARINSGDEIWQLVHYVRSLPEPPREPAPESDPAK